MMSYDSQFLLLMVIAVALAMFFPFFIIYVLVRKSPPVREILGAFVIFCILGFWVLGFMPAIINWDLNMFFDRLIMNVGGEPSDHSNKIEYKSFDEEYWEAPVKRQQKIKEFGDVQFSLGE